MKKVFLSLAALATILSANASGSWKLGDKDYTVDTLLHVTAGPGIVTTGLRLTTDGNTSNIFYSEIDLTNPNLEIRGVQAGDGEAFETVRAMGEGRTEYGEGIYVAGVNGDFFNMGGEKPQTNGASMADSYLFQPAVSSSWNTWAAYTTVAGAKDVKILQSVDASVGLTFPTGTSYTVHVDPYGGEAQPAGRWDNYLCIYTGALASTTRTNCWGSECTAKVISGSIADNDAVFEVTCEPVGDCSDNPEHGNMAIPADGVVLSGVGAARLLVYNLKVGDKVSMGTSIKYNGEDLKDITTIIGGCSMLVMRGEVASDSYFSDGIIDHFSSNQARTAVGYNKDRSKLIFLVADKYDDSKYTTADAVKKTYGTSNGYPAKTLAYIMKELGCYTALNNDGGGSAQLFNDQRGVVNVPYGGDYLRPVANGVFAVSTTDMNDTEVTAIEVMQKDVKLANGEKFTPTVYGYNKDGVLVDKNVSGFTLSVASSLGSVAGNTFTANATKGATLAVVSKGNIKCGVRILTNSGGTYVTSGDDNAPVMVTPAYTPDVAMGIDQKELELTENWKFLNENIDASWDSSAPNWASPDAIKSKPCPRFATAYDGKLYTINMMTMSIAEFDQQGNMKDVYKLPSLEGRVINDTPDYYGCAISRDDAGNFLLGHYFTKPMSNYIISIYNPKNGAIKHIDLSEGFELPAGYQFDRIDVIGRVVGDLSKDAYVFIAHKATGSGDLNKILMVHFTGDGNILNTTATVELSPTTYFAGTGNTGTFAQPKYATAAECTEAGIVNSFYWYSKAGGWVQWGVDLFCFEEGNYSPNYAVDWVNYAGTGGFDTFVLNGTRYVVMNYVDQAGAATNGNTMNIIVKDLAGNTLTTWENPDYYSTYGYSSITAIPVSESEVEIYIYNNTVKDANHTSGATAGACLTLKDGSVTTGIEDVIVSEEEADSDAAPVYYNLQGVQVKNPAQGIYIIKRGNKATKQFIR